jgi:hypothetical protein
MEALSVLVALQASMITPERLDMNEEYFCASIPIKLKKGESRDGTVQEFVAESFPEVS